MNNTTTTKRLVKKQEHWQAVFGMAEDAATIAIASAEIVKLERAIQLPAKCPACSLALGHPGAHVKVRRTAATLNTHGVDGRHEYLCDYCLQPYKGIRDGVCPPEHPLFLKHPKTGRCATVHNRCYDAFLPSF